MESSTGLLIDQTEAHCGCTSLDGHSGTIYKLGMARRMSTETHMAYLRCSIMYDHILLGRAQFHADLRVGWKHTQSRVQKERKAKSWQASALPHHLVKEDKYLLLAVCFPSRRPKAEHVRHTVKVSHSCVWHSKDWKPGSPGPRS